MQTITATPAGDRIRVAIPFDLKDAFKDAFRGTKFDGATKTWSIPKSQSARLQSWIEAVNASGALEELNKIDEAVLSEEEIRRLESELASTVAMKRAQADIRTSEEARAARQMELLEKLTAEKSALDQARTEAEAAKAAADASAEDVEARIAHITTRAEIEGLRRDMKKNWIPKAYAKPHFEAAQARLLEIHRGLKAAGVACRAVALAVDANFNRKDRDLKDLDAKIEFVVAAAADE